MSFAPLYTYCHQANCYNTQTVNLVHYLTMFSLVVVKCASLVAAS